MTASLFLFAVATAAALYLAVQGVLGFDASRFDDAGRS